MQITSLVGRKVTMLATVLMVPGGLLLLVAFALAVVCMRTARGRRLLVPLKRRIPPRVRAHVRRAVGLLNGEKFFLSSSPTVHSS